MVTIKMATKGGVSRAVMVHCNALVSIIGHSASPHIGQKSQLIICNTPQNKILM